jgi:hypothetical protein
MLKTALAAALIVGAATFIGNAKNSPVQYYFGTGGGNEWCDGLLLTQKGKIFTGTHNSPGNQCPEGD